MGGEERERQVYSDLLGADDTRDHNVRAIYRLRALNTELLREDWCRAQNGRPFTEPRAFCITYFSVCGQGRGQSTYS